MSCLLIVHLTLCEAVVEKEQGDLNQWCRSGTLIPRGSKDVTL